MRIDAPLHSRIRIRDCDHSAALFRRRSRVNRARERVLDSTPIIDAGEADFHQPGTTLDEFVRKLLDRPRGIRVAQRRGRETRAVGRSDYLGEDLRPYGAERSPRWILRVDDVGAGLYRRQSLFDTRDTHENLHRTHCPRRGIEPRL